MKRECPKCKSTDLWIKSPKMCADGSAALQSAVRCGKCGHIVYGIPETSVLKSIDAAWAAFEINDSYPCLIYGTKGEDASGAIHLERIFEQPLRHAVINTIRNGQTKKKA